MNDGVLDVLIVDDEPDVANSTAEILASAGFAVEVRGTVPEARDVLATREVRSVLLDHTIVDWTQTDCSEERDDGPAVIVMSGLGRGELAQLEESHGDRLFACLAKPVPSPDRDRPDSGRLTDPSVPADHPVGASEGGMGLGMTRSITTGRTLTVRRNTRVEEGFIAPTFTRA